MTLRPVRPKRGPGPLEWLTAAMLLAAALLPALYGVPRPRRAVLHTGGTSASRRAAETVQQGALERLTQVGAIDRRTAAVAERVGREAARLSGDLSDPAAAARAVERAQRLAPLVSESAAEELKALIVDENELKALSPAEGSAIDLEHSKIRTIRSHAGPDGRKAMTVELIDPHGRTATVEVTDPAEVKSLEPVEKLYEAADRNPVLRLLIDVANHGLQMGAPAAAPEDGSDQTKSEAQKKQ